jgi:hypothetical protein
VLKEWLRAESDSSQQLLNELMQLRLMNTYNLGYAVLTSKILNLIS